MPDKKSFKQTMGQEKVDKKKVIRLVVLSVVGLVLLTVLFMAIGGKDEESAAPETVSTPMVPTSLRYYDPMSEETYETGVNYVILNQSDGSRIRVSDDGRVVEIDDAGNVVREISNGADYISTVTGLMKSDNQVAMAMAGLQTSLESEEPDVNGFDLFEQDFLDYIDRKGWDFNDVMSTLYSAGYGPDELYALQDKGVAWQSVVDDVVKNASQQTQKDEEPTISGNQTTTGPTQVTLENEKDTTSSTSSDLPSWLQPIDVNGTMNALVDSLVATTGTGTTSASRTAYEQQNRQAEKVAWLEDQQSVEFSYDGRLTQWDLAQGSVVPITLVTGLNTDMPGEIVGLVRQNIYDTLTGTNIVIPKGSRVIATYDSSVAFAQERVAIAWNRLITPDGYSYTLPGFLGVDGEGYSGNEDKHSNHIWSLIGGAMLASIIDLGTNASSTVANNYSTAYPSMSPLWQVLYSGASASGDVASQYVEKLVNRQPTIWIRPGAQITMLVTDTISFRR